MNSLANKQHSEHQQIPGKEALLQQIQPPDQKTHIKKSIKIANTAIKRKITDSAGNTRKDDRVESGRRDDGEEECSDGGGGDLDDDEDEKADIEAQNALLLEAGAVIPKGNWIPVAAAKEPTTTKVKPDKQDDCVSAMQIKWTPNEAKTKRSEHHAEIETKLIQHGGQVAKKLEAQRGFDQQHQKQLEPPPGLVMAGNASNSHIHHPQQPPLSQPALTAAPVKSTALTSTNNPIANARAATTNLPPPTNPINTFKPKVTLKAGFDSSSPGAGGIGKNTPPRDYKRDGPIGNQYKFLKYPEADSSSILFHSLQGDLMRKRRQIATSPAVNNNTALVGLAITSSAADTTVPSETLSHATSSKSAPLSSSTAITNAPNLPPAPTVRMDSNSVTDLSQFYHTPSSLHPLFLETLSDRLYAIFLAPQPDFWKPDRDALSCTLCNVDFDWPFVRRHHCRKCGDVFCASCSQFRAAIRRDGTLIADPGIAVERVCGPCFQSMM